MTVAKASPTANRPAVCSQKSAADVSPTWRSRIGLSVVVAPAVLIARGADMRLVKGLCVLLFAVTVAGCQGSPPAPPPSTPAPAPQPYGSLAEVMRGIPFPHSNVIFDAQTVDPGAQKKPEAAWK